jgi:hypothetical protein
MVELRLAPVQRWLRRNFGFLFSGSGRKGLLLCAATMSLATGPMGALPALATLGNAWLGAKARASAAGQKGLRDPVSARVHRPATRQSGHAVPCDNQKTRPWEHAGDAACGAACAPVRIRGNAAAAVGAGGRGGG